MYTTIPRPRRARVLTICASLAVLALLAVPAVVLANPANLSIVKTADYTSVTAGSQIGFKITVSIKEQPHSGSPETGCILAATGVEQCPAKGMVLTDNLPTTPATLNLSWSVKTESPGFTCAVTSNVLNCDPIDMTTPNESLFVDVVSATSASASVCGTVTNPKANATYKLADGSSDSFNSGPASTIVTCPQFGSLIITKNVVGAPAGWTGTFTFSVSCTSGFSKTGVTIDTSKVNTATVSNIPAPNSCTVAETSGPNPPTGYSAWSTSYSPSNATVAVTANSSNTVTVTNATSHIPPGQGDFQVTKTVGGNLNGWTGGQFSFTVTCGTSITTVTLTVGSTGSTVSSQIFGPYAPGTVCSVTEGSLPAAGTYASWVNSPIYSPVSASATIVSDQTVKVAVTNTRSRSDPSPTAFQVVQGETATPVRFATPPVTSTDGSSPGGDSMPLFALLICLSFGGLGLAVVEAQRRSIRR